MRQSPCRTQAKMYKAIAVASASSTHCTRAWSIMEPGGGAPGRMLRSGTMANRFAAYQVANGMGSPWAPALGGTVGGAMTIVFIFLLAPRWGVTGAATANLWAWTALFPLAYMLWKLRPRQPAAEEAVPAARTAADRRTDGAVRQ